MLPERYTCNSLIVLIILIWLYLLMLKINIKYPVLTIFQQ